MRWVINDLSDFMPTDKRWSQVSELVGYFEIIAYDDKLVSVNICRPDTKKRFACYDF